MVFALSPAPLASLAVRSAAVSDADSENNDDDDDADDDGAAAEAELEDVKDASTAISCAMADISILWSLTLNNDKDLKSSCV